MNESIETPTSSPSKGRKLWRPFQRNDEVESPGRKIKEKYGYQSSPSPSPAKDKKKVSLRSSPSPSSKRKKNRNFNLASPRRLRKNFLDQKRKQMEETMKTPSSEFDIVGGLPVWEKPKAGEQQQRAARRCGIQIQPPGEPPAPRAALDQSFALKDIALLELDDDSTDGASADLLMLESIEDIKPQGSDDSVPKAEKTLRRGTYKTEISATSLRSSSSFALEADHEPPVSKRQNDNRNESPPQGAPPMSHDADQHTRTAEPQSFAPESTSPRRPSRIPSSSTHPSPPSPTMLAESTRFAPAKKLSSRSTHSSSSCDSHYEASLRPPRPSMDHHYGSARRQAPSMGADVEHHAKSAESNAFASESSSPTKRRTSRLMNSSTHSSSSREPHYESPVRACRESTGPEVDRSEVPLGRRPSYDADYHTRRAEPNRIASASSSPRRSSELLISSSREPYFEGTARRPSLSMGHDVNHYGSPSRRATCTGDDRFAPESSSPRRSSKVLNSSTHSSSSHEPPHFEGTARRRRPNPSRDQDVDDTPRRRATCIVNDLNHYESPHLVAIKSTKDNRFAPECSSPPKQNTVYESPVGVHCHYRRRGSAPEMTRPVTRSSHDQTVRLGTTLPACRQVVSMNADSIHYDRNSTTLLTRSTSEPTEGVDEALVRAQEEELLRLALERSLQESQVDNHRPHRSSSVRANPPRVANDDLSREEQEMLDRALEMSRQEHQQTRTCVSDGM